MGRPTNPDTLFTIGSGQGGAVITPIWAEPSVIDVVLNQASAAQNATGNSASLSVSADAWVLVAVNITAITGSVTLSVQSLGADGVWYQLWASASQSATGQVVTSIGPGCAQAQMLGTNIRLVWTVVTGPVTFSASILGKQAV